MTKLTMPRRLRQAFTLMELLVVLVILLLLSALIIPRIVGISDQANSATSANVLAGVNRAVQTFNAQYGKMPSTWDYVIDDTGAPYKLNPKVAPLVQVTALTAGQAKSLTDIGYSGGHTQDSAYTGLPHESIKTWLPITTGRNMLTLVKPTTFGGHYVDFPDRAFGINQFNAEAFKSEYIVVGLAGPTSLRGNSIMESPIIQAADPERYYARVLCVFRVPASDGSQDGKFTAQYMGCFGPDGTSTNDNINKYNVAQQPLN